MAVIVFLKGLCDRVPLLISGLAYGRLCRDIFFLFVMAFIVFLKGLCDRVPLLSSGMAYGRLCRDNYFVICYDSYCFFEMPLRQSPLARLWHSHTGDSVGTFFLLFAMAVIVFLRGLCDRVPLPGFGICTPETLSGQFFFLFAMTVIVYLKGHCDRVPLPGFGIRTRETLSGQFFCYFFYLL